MDQSNLYASASTLRSLVRDSAPSISPSQRQVLRPPEGRPAPQLSSHPERAGKVTDGVWCRCFSFSL